MRELTMTVKVNLTGKPNDDDAKVLASRLGAAITSQEFWNNTLSGSDLPESIKVKSIFVRLNPEGSVTAAPPALERVDYDHGRHVPAMFSIGEELRTRDMQLIARSHGYEIKMPVHEVPPEIVEQGDFQAMLNYINVPSEIEGGYRLIGAWDNEDGEVVLAYIRPIDFGLPPNVQRVPA